MGVEHSAGDIPESCDRYKKDFQRIVNTIGEQEARQHLASQINEIVQTTPFPSASIDYLTPDQVWDGFEVYTIQPVSSLSGVVYKISPFNDSVGVILSTIDQTRRECVQALQLEDAEDLPTIVTDEELRETVTAYYHTFVSSLSSAVEPEPEIEYLRTPDGIIDVLKTLASKQIVDTLPALLGKENTDNERHHKAIKNFTSEVANNTGLPSELSSLSNLYVACEQMEGVVRDSSFANSTYSNIVTEDDSKTSRLLTKYCQARGFAEKMYTALGLFSEGHSSYIPTRIDMILTQLITTQMDISPNRQDIILNIQKLHMEWSSAFKNSQEQQIAMGMLWDFLDYICPSILLEDYELVKETIKQKNIEVPKKRWRFGRN